MPQGPYLSQTDTIMWMVEADPLLRSTILGVVLLEAAPEWARVRNRMEEVTHHIPALREKVAPVPLHPTLLRWIPDPDFDLDFHLRRISLPTGSGVQDLLDWARTATMGGFDVARPLWEFTLVEGVGHDGFLDGAAFVMKAHHVVTDGIGAVQLAAHLFNFEPSPPAHEPTDRPAARSHGPLSLLRDVIAHDVELGVDLARHQLGSIVPNLLQAARHPQQAAKEILETAKSIGKVVAPAITPKSPVMVGRMTTTNYRLLEVPVDALHDAAKRAGGRLNDAYLAGITAGLHRYHEHHGHVVDELRVAMPVSLREDEHAEGGNHITVMRFQVPVAATTVKERIEAMRSVVDGIRHERSLEHTSTIAGFLNLMPRGVIGAMLKGVDFLASNVPGVPLPMWLEGSRVVGFFPFGPTAGSALNVTLMSYNGMCCIGVNADAAAIPDPDVLTECLRVGFAEVCAYA
ncbi:MAG: wax ester/triacylglycerol synthase family O-acyltransferase [Actinomycetota bacterium]|nr:wax ester/triacylglycerol synthase family O-acyltransferase [Actinomycetota bacterium]